MLIFISEYCYSKTVTWYGNHNNNSNWSSGQNWTLQHQINIGNTTFVANFDALFFQGTTRRVSNNDLSAFSFNGITFNSNAGVFTLNGNAIYLNNSVINNSANNQNINLSSITLNATRTINASAGNITINSPIQGNGGITKTGVNTLRLNGNNSYSGATTISDGIISIGSTSAIASTSQVNLGNASTLLYTGGVANITKNITVTAGSATVQNSGSGLLTLSGALSKDGTTLVLNGGTQGIDVTGVISGTSANSDLDVYGNVTLSAPNTYNGPTTIYSGGNLTAAVANAMGNTTSVVMHNGGSILVSANSSINDSASMSMNGSTLAFNGDITESIGALTLSANSIIDMSGGIVRLTFSSLLSALSSSSQLLIYNYTMNSDALYFASNANLAESLQYINFYSDNGTTLLTDSFIDSQTTPYEVKPFPEPESWFSAGALLLGAGIWMIKKKRAQAALSSLVTESRES
jgi:autotransporter-associated beta strand protein